MASNRDNRNNGSSTEDEFMNYIMYEESQKEEHNYTPPRSSNSYDGRWRLWL